MKLVPLFSLQQQIKIPKMNTNTNINQHEFLHNNVQYIILSGKNKQGNNDLLDDADAADVWFHISNFSSGHVILKNPNQLAINKIPRQVLKRCACICKSSTKTSEKNCAIIYTQRSNIEKTSILGQVNITTNTQIRTIIL